MTAASRSAGWSNAFSAGWMLASREWIADARQSRSSVAWPLLYPLAYTALVLLLRPLLATEVDGPWRLAVLVFIGFSLWQTWIDVLRMQLGAIRRHRGLVSRGELDSRALLATAMVAVGLQLAPRLVVMVAAACTVMQASPAAVLALVVFSLLVLANGAAIGTLLQPFATLSPGVDRAVQGVSLALLMTGGVLVPMPADPAPALSVVMAANPLGVLLDAARGGLAGGMVSDPGVVLGWSALTLAGLVAAPRLGRRLLPIVTERLGS